MSKTFQIIKEYEQIQNEEGWQDPKKDLDDGHEPNENGLIGLRSIEPNDFKDE